MSRSVQEVIAGKDYEIKALQKLADAYPDATLVSGRLYEVEKFLPDDKANHVVIEGGEAFPCLLINGCVFLREAFRHGVKLEHLVHRILERDPSAIFDGLL